MLMHDFTGESYMDAKTCGFLATNMREKPNISTADELFCSKLIIKMVLEVEDKISKGCDSFLSGLLTETELWFAEAILDLKHAYTKENLKLHILLPPQKEYRFSKPKDDMLFRRILSEADEVISLEYREGQCFEEVSARYMLHKASHLIAVSDMQNKRICDSIESACNKGISVSIIKLNKLPKQITVRGLTIVR